MATVSCTAAAIILKMMQPASLHALAVLLVLALPLACVWYVALRLTRHPMTSELHQIANGIIARLRPRLA